MNKTIQEVNENTQISVAKFEENILKYVSIRAQAQFKLYDNYWQSSSSSFSIKELKKSILETSAEDIEFFKSSMTGVIHFDLDRIDYAIKKTKNESIRDMLKNAYTVIKATTSLECLYDLKKRVYSHKVRYVTINPRVYVSTYIASKKELHLDDKAVLASLKSLPNSIPITVDLRDIHRRSICKFIGISEDDYSLHLKSGQPFFISEITQADELNFIKLIISGDLILDGKYGALLKDSLIKYYDEGQATLCKSQVLLPFQDAVFSTIRNEITSRIQSVRENVELTGGRVVYFNSDFVYCDVLTEKEVPLTNNSSFIGNYTIDYTTGQSLSPFNRIVGISGEFISQDELEQLGYFTKAVPIDIYEPEWLLNGHRPVLKLHTSKYFCIDDVYTDDLYNIKLKPLIGHRFQFESIAVEDKLMELFNTTVRTDIIEDIKSLITPSFKYKCTEDVYLTLVADYTLGLICADCDSSNYTYIYNYQSFADETTILCSKYDAELTYNKINK